MKLNYKLIRTSLVQIGHVSLHYIDYPIDTLLIIKHLNVLKRENQVYLISILFLFLILPNLILTLLSILFNLRRVSTQLLILFAILFLFNLEPLACFFVYIGLSARKKKLLERRNDHRIDLELHAASFNQLVSTCFRAFINNYAFSILLLCQEYRFYSTTSVSTASTKQQLNIWRIEIFKIAVSVLKLAIYSSRFIFHFVHTEFKLGNQNNDDLFYVFKFYLIRLTTSLMFSLGRSFLLVYALTSRLKFIFLVIFLIKFALIDVFYLVYYFSSAKTVTTTIDRKLSYSFNSLVLFWSVFISMLKQIVYLSTHGYYDLISVIIETFVFWGFVCYDKRFAPLVPDVFFYTVCLLLVFGAVLIECFCVKSGFMELLRKWIAEQSQEAAALIRETSDRDENVNLFAMSQLAS